MTDTSEKPAIKQADKRVEAIAETHSEHFDARAHAVAEMEKVEAETPTPTQEELDAAKRPAVKDARYRTRQDKAN